MLPHSPGQHLPATPAPPDTGEVLEALTLLAEQVAREHERAGHREQIIDRLHAENQELRHGLLQEALTPVRAGLYRLYDTVHREAARWRGPETPSAEHVGALLEAIAEEVAEVLARTGAERVEAAPGDPYDTALHRPVRTEPVETGRDGLVVAVLADGFATGDRVLRKAGVVVGRTPAPVPPLPGAEEPEAEGRGAGARGGGGGGREERPEEKAAERRGTAARNGDEGNV
ncbi:nucleotide exchange factor GrpE [Streptosporangium sp. NBC_01469]|uniref:nucleotide exchange factor GrpE n=1 Tax=Streptosporangium sp. NBC_01469 TaxID=2903898 RepID=UPI002E2E52BA|nr:nucleotide exchange factor GrpE [Streptosporangium sp. NBC_01469]